MQAADVGRQVLARLRKALPDALAATVAAALAWWLARTVFGHEHPVFAAVTGIICLAPGLPNHGRQAIGLVLGVATGILVGELALLFPGEVPMLRIAIAAFVAIMVASGYGLQAVVPIQAGVSALLVLALGSDSAGIPRLIDVFCGTTVGLLFSQVLFTPDPVQELRAAERALLQAIGGAFAASKATIETDDPAKRGDNARRAMKRFSDAHRHLVALASVVDNARVTATWSLRGRLTRRDLRVVAAQFERRSTRCYAASLLFGSALATAIERDAPPPPGTLRAGIDAATGLCEIDRDMAPPLRLSLDDVPGEWRRCFARLDEAMEAIRFFRAAELPDPDRDTSAT